MALQCLQAMYWPGDGESSVQPVTTRGYTNAATIGCFYVLSGVPMRRWLARAWQRIVWRLPERLYVLARVIEALYTPTYGQARSAVRGVASSGLSDRKLWGAIGQRIGRDANEAENLFRHLRATELYGPAVHPRRYARNLQLELAWLALKERHR